MKTTLFALVILLLATTPSFAATTLKLRGDNRVVNVYARHEIPDYLRSSKCHAYAYEQKFEKFVYLKDGKTLYPPAAGSVASDIQTLKRYNVCLLRLKEADMLQGTHKPVTIYEIDMLGAGSNEIRVGQNHRSMDDGNYVLQSGARFTVKNNVMVSGSR